MSIGRPWLPITASRASTPRRVPARDFDEDDLRQNLPQCVAALDQLLTAGNTVYVHCTAGMGRAPSTVIAYLVWREHWTDRGGDRICEPTSRMHAERPRHCAGNVRPS